MKYFNFLLLTVFLLVVQGCASKSFDKATGYKVIYTADNTGKIPVWVHSTPTEEKDGKMLVGGVIDIAGNQSPARGLTAADLQARAELAKYIKTRLAVKLQYANEGFGYDNQVLYQIVSQVSDVSNIVRVNIIERGFAKIADVDEYGLKTRFTCYSRISVDVQELNNMVSRSLREAEEQGRISEPFREKVEQEWKQFFQQSN